MYRENEGMVKDLKEEKKTRSLIIYSSGNE